MKPFLILIATSLGLGCWGGAQTPAPEGEVLLERIAAEFASASPLADPGDARARDAAAAQLVGCRNFRAAAGPQFLWGGFDPANGYDPEQYRLTVFDPLVQTLEDNKMPPEDLQRHHPAGIADAAVRSELLRLARAFVVEADAAVAFESSRTPVAPQSRGG